MSQEYCSHGTGGKEKDLAKLNVTIEQDRRRREIGSRYARNSNRSNRYFAEISLDQKSAVDTRDCLWEVEAVFNMTVRVRKILMNIENLLKRRKHYVLV